MEKQRDLWRRAFGDTERYIKYYFENKAPKSICLADCEGDTLCSMAFLTPYEAQVHGEVQKIPYLVGVATEPAYRHQGRMTAMLQKGFRSLQEKDVPLVFLTPADPAIYDGLGFVPCYQRDTMVFEGDAQSALLLREWESLRESEKKAVAVMAESRLQKEAFDLHLIHSVSYYEEVNRELQALEGAVWTVWKEDAPIATAHYICEDGSHECVEVICGREDACEVLACFLVATKGEPLSVEDCYFLQKTQGMAKQRKKQPNPYIMVKLLCDEVRPIRTCYINDIT